MSKKISEMNSAELRGAVLALGGDPTMMPDDDELRGFLEAKNLSTGMKFDVNWKKTIWNSLNILIAIVLFIVSGLSSDFATFTTIGIIAALGMLVVDIVSVWNTLKPDGWAEIRVFIAKAGAEITALLAIVLYVTMVTGFQSIQPAVLWIASFGLLVDAIAEVEES